MIRGGAAAAAAAHHNMNMDDGWNMMQNMYFLVHCDTSRSLSAVPSCSCFLCVTKKLWRQSGCAVARSHTTPITNCFRCGAFEIVRKSSDVDERKERFLDFVTQLPDEALFTRDQLVHKKSVDETFISRRCKSRERHVPYDMT